MKLFRGDDLILAGRSIGIQCNTSAISCEKHVHDFIEIEYILSGEAVQTVDNVDYAVKRGDMLFINYGSTHSFDSVDRFYHIEIFFSPELIDGGGITPENALSLFSLSAFDEMRGEQNGGKVSFSGGERKDVEDILSLMVREFRENLPSSDRVIENCLNILMIKMLRSGGAAGAHVVMNDVWQELRKYIDENPTEELTLASLAKKSFYNPSYFSRIFKQKFGTSLSEYVRTRRLELAAEYLSDGELSVDEILYKVGFSDRSAFYHAFSRQYGMTPAEYRQKK